MASLPTGSKDILLKVKSEKLQVTIKGKTVPPYAIANNSSSHESFVKIFCAESVGDVALENKTAVNLLSPVDNLSYATEHILSEPLFYEQQTYEIIVKAEKGDTIIFDHDNQYIRESVTPVDDEDQTHLSGVINFRNEIGYSDLKFYLGDDKSVYLKIIIEVFPSKIDYKSDYQEILADVTNEVYNLVFDFLKRTYLSYQDSGNYGNSLVEFFSILQQIYEDFLKAADRILSHPHHQLEVTREIIPARKIKRTDNQTIRWIELHPDQVKMNGGKVSAERALAVKKHVTFDTNENRLAKHILQMTIKRLDSFKKNYKLLDRQIDQTVLDQIDNMIKHVNCRCHASVFAEVGTYRNSSGMSLVFSMAPGYRELYKYYLMLQRGLSVSGDIFNISQKDLAVLYEYWCFIKLNRIMRDNYKLERQNILKIKHDGLYISLAKGHQSKAEYSSPGNNERIILSYNPIEEKMPTIAQRPDNVLTLEKEGNSATYQYVFDSKYKISMTYEESDTDKGANLTPGPTEADINTMHRYRDAIVSASGFYPYERTMFGAYVLFPYGNEKEYKKHKFYKSIEKVNIGGLPFLPSATTLVEELLDDLISDSPDAAFERTTLPLGIEKKLAKTNWAVRDVMVIGPLRDRNQWNEWEKGNFCHVQESKIADTAFPIHYIAIYQCFDDDAIIQYFGEVTKCIPDQEVPSMSDKKCYRFEVKKWETLDSYIQATRNSKMATIKIEYTNKFLLDHCTELSELQLQSEAEYRLYSEIKRVANNISIRKDKCGIYFQCDDAKINLQNGNISAQRNGTDSFSCEIETFMQEPGPTFRRLQQYLTEAIN